MTAGRNTNCCLHRSISTGSSNGICSSRIKPSCCTAYSSSLVPPMPHTHTMPRMRPQLCIQTAGDALPEIWQSPFCSRCRSRQLLMTSNDTVPDRSAASTLEPVIQPAVHFHCCSVIVRFIYHPPTSLSSPTFLPPLPHPLPPPSHPPPSSPIPPPLPLTKSPSPHNPPPPALPPCTPSP